MASDPATPAAPRIATRLMVFIASPSGDVLRLRAMLRALRERSLNLA
jgi:hypothetical protein